MRCVSSTVNVNPEWPFVNNKFGSVLTVRQMKAQSRAEVLATNLRKLREDRGLKQVDVAVLAKVDRSYVSSLENATARSFPKTELLSKFARALNCEIGELTGKEIIRQVTPYESNPQYRAMIDALVSIADDDRAEIIRHVMWATARARTTTEDNILEFVPAREIIEEGVIPFPVPPGEFKERDFDYPRDEHYWRSNEPVEQGFAAGQRGIIANEGRVLNGPSPTEVLDRLRKIVRIKGDSMEPRYCDGDLVRIDTTKRPVDGDLVAVYITAAEDEGGIIGILNHDGGKTILKKSNPAHDPVILPDPEWQFVGVVVEIVSGPQKQATASRKDKRRKS